MEINFTGDIVREISAAKTTRIAELEECAQGATIRTKKHEELLRIYAASFPLQCLSERNPTTSSAQKPPNNKIFDTTGFRGIMATQKSVQ